MVRWKWLLPQTTEVGGILSTLFLLWFTDPFLSITMYTNVGTFPQLINYYWLQILLVLNNNSEESGSCGIQWLPEYVRFLGTSFFSLFITDPFFYPQFWWVLPKICINCWQNFWRWVLGGSYGSRWLRESVRFSGTLLRALWLINRANESRPRKTGFGHKPFPKQWGWENQPYFLMMNWNCWQLERYQDFRRNSSRQDRAQIPGWLCNQSLAYILRLGVKQGWSPPYQVWDLAKGRSNPCNTASRKGGPPRAPRAHPNSWAENEVKGA